jgi:hypothetical protein
MGIIFAFKAFKNNYSWTVVISAVEEILKHRACPGPTQQLDYHSLATKHRKAPTI